MQNENNKSDVWNCRKIHHTVLEIKSLRTMLESAVCIAPFLDNILSEICLLAERTKFISTLLNKLLCFLIPVENTPCQEVV